MSVRSSSGFIDALQVTALAVAMFGLAAVVSLHLVKAREARFDRADVFASQQIDKAWNARELMASTTDQRALIVWLRGQVEGRVCQGLGVTPIIYDDASYQGMAAGLVAHKQQVEQACVRQQLGRMLALDARSPAIPVMTAVLHGY
jgi:hypothetical protein